MISAYTCGMETSKANYSTKVLDHLGLIAGMCEELQISSIIDTHIANDSADKILSTGNAVVGMILNGLGFVNKRLYLVPQFFENKPAAKLLNVSYLKADHFNDDALGRALDSIYEFGVSEMFALLSSSVVRHLTSEYGLQVQGGQLDNTNFHLHGGAKSLGKATETGTDILNITRGYSKDHRPDLVQVGLQLIVENRSGIPLLMRVLSGNEEESGSYGSFIEAYTNDLKKDFSIDFMVVDSKLYNLKNLKILGNREALFWLTRVPNGLQVVKEVIENGSESSVKPLPMHPGYRYAELGSNYGGVNQRWVLLHSTDKYTRDVKNLDRRVLKTREKEQKSYKKLSRERFTNEEEAVKAMQDFGKSLQYSRLEEVSIVKIEGYQKAGKPKKGQLPDKIRYAVVANCVACDKNYEAKKGKMGYFVLATNQMDAEKFDASALLSKYKEQSKVEQSFRFLKNPNIVASSLFVQKPERMAALLTVITLCLLIYATLEFVTRTLLKKQNRTFENQVGKQVQNPTMRWIFHCFEGVHILYLPDMQPLVLNLKNKHHTIINLLGKNYLKYYT